MARSMGVLALVMTMAMVNGDDDGSGARRRGPGRCTRVRSSDRLLLLVRFDCRQRWRSIVAMPARASATPMAAVIEGTIQAMPLCDLLATP